MKILKGSQGIVLVIVIMVMVILLSITGAGLLFSSLNLKTASNLKTGTAAIHVADAGIQHALALIPVGTTFPYTTEITLLSSTPFGNGYTYTVKAVNDPASGGGDTRAVLTAEASGPNSSVRKIKAHVGRSTTSWIPPGAVYIPGAATSPVAFDPSGTSFIVTGNDTNYDNSAGSQPAIIGMTSPTGTVVTNIINALDTDSKRQKVTGLGYAAGPPVTPSVQTTSVNIDVNEVAQKFINQLTTVKHLNGLHWTSTECPQSNPCTLGTDAVPQITYIKEGTNHIHLDGYVNGSGVLVIEGRVHLKKEFNFHGLIIQLAPAMDSEDNDENLKFDMQGNARIYGALVLGPNEQNLRFKLKNTSALRYSSQAINMVNSWWGSCCLPKPAKLIAWSEVVQ